MPLRESYFTISKSIGIVESSSFDDDDDDDDEMIKFCLDEDEDEILNFFIRFKGTSNTLFSPIISRTGRDDIVEIVSFFFSLNFAKFFLNFRSGKGQLTLCACMNL